MRMVFLCGHCRGKLAADSSHAGNPVKCPRCQALVECPAPEDPGYEFVVEPEPEAPPPRPRDREPEPRRKSSRRLVRDARPIRRRRSEPGNATKAALLALLGVAVVGIVVVLALFAFSGAKLDPKKGGVAQGGGLLPFGGDLLPTAKPAVLPPGWNELRHDRIRVFVPGKVKEGTTSNWHGGTARNFVTRDLVIGLTHNATAVDAAGDHILPRIATSERKTSVSGLPAREFVIGFGREQQKLLYVKLGTSAYYVDVVSHGLGEDPNPETIDRILASFRLAE